jgi:RNA polymerase sigma-70 factor, ECF subfamily
MWESMSADRDRRVRFELLYERHQAAVRSYAVRRSAPAGVEDVVADTFLVAWRRLEEVPESELPWLLGVARRVLADQRRAATRRRSLAERLKRDAPGTLEWVSPVGLSPELSGALRALTEHEREALLLVAWDGLTPRDAAVVVGCSSAAFRVRLHRARERVVAQLGITSNAQTEAHR